MDVEQPEDLDPTLLQTSTPVQASILILLNKLHWCMYRLSEGQNYTNGSVRKVTTRVDSIEAFLASEKIIKETTRNQWNWLRKMGNEALKAIGYGIGALILYWITKHR